MKVNEIPASPEIPPTSPQEPVLPPPKKFGKKLYLVIGIVAVAAVISVFTVLYILPRFLPAGEAATIPLGLNYNTGESMTYEMTITINAMGQTITQTMTVRQEVLNFDGVNYTMRYTTQYQSQEFSYTVKMNKTGCIIEFSGLPPELQQIYTSITGIPGYGAYFVKEEMKTGESWQIPIDLQTQEVSLVGTVSFRIGEVKSITTPAGTYRVFRIDVTASNVQGTYQYMGSTASVLMSMSGYEYLEFGTCCPIECNFNIQETVSYMGQTVSMSMTMQMRLMDHIRQ